MAYDPPGAVGNYGEWEFSEVLYNGGPRSWSVAAGLYGEEPRLGIRWNGDDDDPDYPSFPTIGGRPLWFIVPRELEESVRTVVSIMTP